MSARTVNPQKRFVRMLGITAAASAAIAALVVWLELPALDDFVPYRLFPDLEARTNDVHKLAIVIGKGLQGVDTLTITKDAEGIWHMEERSGFPVQINLVRRMISGLAEMKVHERRTSREERLGALGLRAPEELGSAVRITLSSRHDAPLAGILIGNRPVDVGDIDGEGAVYVRKAGETNTWLARASLPLRLAPAAWLKLDILDVAGADIRSASLMPRGVKPVAVSRAKPGEEFTYQRSKRLAAPDHQDAAETLAQLRFEDVRPQTDVLFKNAHRVAYETFSGLRLSFVIAAAGKGFWARVSASAVVSADDSTDTATGERARALNARLAGWAFKVPTPVIVQIIQQTATVTQK